MNYLRNFKKRKFKIFKNINNNSIIVICMLSFNCNSINVNSELRNYNKF